METLIPSVPLALMDGRSAELRLSQGALLRTMQNTGLDVAEMSGSDNIKRMAFVTRLLYECSDIRRIIGYDDFSDLIPVDAGPIVATLFEKFGDKAKGGSSPNGGGALTGSNGGQSGATILDFPTRSSGDSPRESSEPSASDTGSAA